MEGLKRILQIQRELEKFPKEELERIKRVLTYEHACKKFHTQQCCGQDFCKACYLEHVRDNHSPAKYFLQKITPGPLVTARFNEKEEEIIRSPEIQATSKGRIKCCGKFRSQNRHFRHCQVHHKGESQEQILKYKDAPETQRVSNHRKDPISTLTQEEILRLMAIIKEIQND